MSLDETDNEFDETQPIGLVQALRLLSKKDFNALIKRIDAAVDPAKRIDVPSQVARVLLLSADLKEPSRLGRAAADLLQRVADVGGRLVVDAVPPGLDVLERRGLLFPKKTSQGLTLFLPVAYLLQLKAWSSEDARSARALLSQASAEVQTAIASHYAGRAVAPPLSLALEDAWLALANTERLSGELQALPVQERKLLHKVEEVGGEVDTEELLEMEREPVRLRGASGATPSRRGVGFALERRGFLIPVHPNRHIVPAEVARLVGAERLAERESLRSKIRNQVAREDYIPQRARFAVDVMPLAVALTMAVLSGEGEVRPGVGTPKSFISKMSTRFGRTPEMIGFVSAVSRVAGLWDEGVLSPEVPPGSLRTSEIGYRLFSTWRRGAAWDESRPNGELLRVAGDAREAGAVGVLRSIVIEALQELGDGQWAPWGAIERYVGADPRTAGLTRLLQRQASKLGIELAAPVEIARRMACESLPALGVVDLASPDDGDDVLGPMLRITPRGRAWLADRLQDGDAAPGKFIDSQTLRVGSAAKLSQVLALNALTEVGNVEGDLDLILTPRTLALAIGTGIDPAELRARLEIIAPLPDPIERQLTQASTVLGRAEFVEASGFIWIDDPEVRRMLSTRRSTADLFVSPSPPSGLLIAAGVDLDKLSRRCRTLGVEVLENGSVHFARSTPPSRRGGRSKSDNPPPTVERRSSAPPRPSSPPRPLGATGRAPTAAPRVPGIAPRTAPGAPPSSRGAGAPSHVRSSSAARRKPGLG